MTVRAKGIVARLALTVAVLAIAGAMFAVVAGANNLDRNTAQKALKQVAKKDCLATSGCEGYKAEPVHLVTVHKATGHIDVVSHKNGERFNCRRAVVLRLDHFTNKITFSTGARKCKDLGPQ